MLAVKGKYDGKVVRPLEPVDVPRDSEVIITFLTEGDTATMESSDKANRLAALAGACEGELERPPQGEYEEREQLQ